MTIKRQDIIDAIHEGIANADSKYEQWTRGSSVAYAGVESLIVANVAETLRDRQEGKGYLYLEYPFRDIVDRSGTKHKGIQDYRTLRDGNRADIVLLNELRRPTCTIEIKRVWNSTCLHDLRRIRDLIGTCSHYYKGSLRRGFLAMWIAKEANQSKTGEQRIKDYAAKVQRTIRDKLEGLDDMGLAWNSSLGEIGGAAKEFAEEYPYWRGASFCIEIASANKRSR